MRIIIIIINGTGSGWVLHSPLLAPSPYVKIGENPNPNSVKAGFPVKFGAGTRGYDLYCHVYTQLGTTKFHRRKGKNTQTKLQHETYGDKGMSSKKIKHREMTRPRNNYCIRKKSMNS